MAERATMPTFVPRTVASFERAATAVARRVAAPVRMLATRALSFADRLVGTWTGSGVTGAAVESGARTIMRAATRGSDMIVPRPWYEVDADEDAIWPQQAAARAAARAHAATTTTFAATATATTPAAATAAERGAAITRTAVTAAPDVVARAGDAAGDEAARAAATEGVTATAELRVAEALGLRTAATPIAAADVTAARTTTAPAARATTPLGRALAHAAWVDAQLRTVAPAVETTARSAGGYVFVAPVDGDRGAEHDATAAARPSTATRETAPAAERAAATPLSTTTAAGTIAAAPTMTAAGSARGTTASTGASTMPAVAAWSAALPDPRLATAMPTAIAQRVTDFVARLVGVQSARDVEPIAAPTVDVVVATADARPAAERTFVVLAPPAAPVASWRPGAAAARVEHAGARVDARVSAAWGEPATRVMAATVATERATATDVVAMPTTAPATTTTARAAAERIYVAPVESTARATGPARLSRFMEQLVGVQAARATAPLPVQTTMAAPAAMLEPIAAMTSTTATTTATTATRAGVAAPMAASGRAPARVSVAAPTDDARAATAMPVAAASAAPVTSSAARVAAATSAATTMAPGAIGRRAEQLGGAVGVRAARLSIDFVDPARLSLLSAAPPPMPTVTPAAEAVGRDTIMPAPQPLFATSAPSLAAPTLTAEEWSLVATFPSAATAVQLAAARQSAQWSGAATARAANAPARTMLAAIAADAAVASQSVAATTTTTTMAAAETPARLPGGRVPRGSFTWPKLADYVPSRAEWAAPVAVALAEQTKQAAPGTPLWGALPALIAVSPSLAASGFGGANGGAANASDAGPAPFAGAGELVRNDGLPAGDGRSGGRVVATARDAAAGEPSAAGASARSDAAAMTLMTAAATREARAAARMGVREVGESGSGADEPAARGDGRPTMPLPPGVDATRAGVGVSNVRPPAAMPLMTAGATSREGAGRAPVGPTARALELARPFLRLVGGGINGDAGAPRSSDAPRFFEQPQPVVAGSPSSDSASRIVEALRSQPAAASSDDRVSLADLTLIAIASATQQVAASPQGGGPTSPAAAPSSSSAAPAAESGHSGKSHNPAQEIEELARAAFDELQRLFAMARERSGEHG